MQAGQMRRSAIITSYDLLKALAVVLMLVDHVGYYFYPDELWLRVIGRFCVPVWLFLVGYARTRELDPRFLIGGLMLVATGFVAGMPVFPLNILFTILALRLVMDFVAERMVTRDGGRHLWPLAVLAALITLPTMLFVEYGTLAILLMLCGWMVRNRDSMADDNRIRPFFVFTVMAFAVTQSLQFGFSGPQFAALAVGTLAVFAVLSLFRPVEYPRLTRVLGPGAGVVRLLGRRTLEIYVLHLILFRFIGVLTQPERYALWNWTWFQS